MDRTKANGVAPEGAAPAGVTKPAVGAAKPVAPIRTNILDRLSFRARSLPAALLLAVLLSFGLLIPWLGFYWDDWPAIWYLHLLGPAGFQDVFAVDRPLLGRLFMLTTSILGESTLAWQIFGLLTRWVCSLALWWVLRLTWPGQARQAAWVVLLFTIYPGFLQHSIAVTYSHGWIVLAAFFVSFATMLLAVRRPRFFWPLMLFSWGLSALVMFTDEYFFGLELLRPVMLWFVLSERTQTVWGKVRRIALQWVPYAAIMIVFLAWRMFLSDTPRGEVQVFGRISGNPLASILELAGTAIQDLFEVGVLAWIETLNPFNLRGLDLRLLLVYAAIAAIAGLLALVYLAGYGRSSPSGQSEAGESRRWAWQATLLGLLALPLGALPFWATYLPIKLKFPWDRFTLAMMLGACLLFAGLLELLVRRRAYKILVLAAAIGLAVGFHFRNGLTYRQDWALQKDFFWQLAWRAPAVEPGTALLTAGLPFRYYTDNSLTGPLNWVLAPENGRGRSGGPGDSRQMPYLLADLEVRLGNGVESLEPGAAIEQPYRATAFSGSTDRALVLYFPPSGCLRVLDPERDQHLSWKRAAASQRVDDLLEQALPLSNLSVIHPVSQAVSAPPEAIFGAEPEPSWCYYYQKAELARQAGNWEFVAALGNQALLHGFAPQDDSELLPFVEGFARSGNWNAAVSLAAQVSSNRTQPAICTLLGRLRADIPPSPENEPALAQVEATLGCSGP